MIELAGFKDRCFANTAGKCKVLTEANDPCNSSCPFYKPKDCKDWVRTEQDGNPQIITPEEYERIVSEYEEDRKPKAVYWRIKRVPVGKE